MSARAVPQKPLKVGIVCEGQRDCADVQVLPRLVNLICPEAICTKEEIVPSGNRPSVLKDAPKVAQSLLAAGCDVVFVLWDVFPEWPDAGGTTDCKEHRKTLNDNLKAAKMTAAPIVPVAVRQAFEAWLLCDADALMAVIAPLTNKKPIPHEDDPDNVSNPKAALKELFKLGKGKFYNESFSARLIASNLESVERLRCSQSFVHFEKKLRAKCKKKS